MKLRAQILALFVATALVGSVVAMNLQQAFAFGFVERQRIGDFQKLTGEFVDKVTTAIGDPGLSQGPQPHLAEFRKLTAQFQRDVINAVLINPPEPDRIFGLLNSYDDGVERIFLGGPDTIPELLQDYGRNVFQIFGLGPR